MDISTHLLVALVALLVSGLTLYSGFGLGTLLMPVFALFFPIEVAVAATALVHFANNLFKLGLVGRHAVAKVAFAFAVPAALAAAAGAWALGRLAAAPSLFSYEVGARVVEVGPARALLGLLILGFAFLELSGRGERWRFPPKLIPVGGALSGFFGGLSGHQGALRSAFLVQAGLERRALIGTMVACSAVVDAVRLVVYGSGALAGQWGRLAEAGAMGLVATGSLAAFAGAAIGSRFLGKVTVRTIRLLVGALLLLVAAGLGSGLL